MNKNTWQLEEMDNNCKSRYYVKFNPKNKKYLVKHLMFDGDSFQTTILAKYEDEIDALVLVHDLIWHLYNKIKIPRKY